MVADFLVGEVGPLDDQIDFGRHMPGGAQVDRRPAIGWQLTRRDAILLVGPKRAADPRFLAAIRPLIDAIPVAAMREANYMVDRDTDKRTPEDAARWLASRLPL